MCKGKYRIRIEQRLSREKKMCVWRVLYYMWSNILSLWVDFHKLKMLTMYPIATTNNTKGRVVANKITKEILKFTKNTWMIEKKPKKRKKGTKDRWQK